MSVTLLPEAPKQNGKHERKTSVVDLMATVSASRLMLWQQCRLKFFFKYVAGIEKPATPALHVGKSIHAVLQAWNIARWRKLPINVDSLKEHFNQYWDANGIDINWKDEQQEQKDGAWKLLESYFQATTIPLDEQPMGVEVKVERDLPGLPRLVGVLDLVRKGGVIVDFKTSSTTPNPDKIHHTHETQLGCYSLLYREATGNDETGFELHHLVKLKTPKVVITALPPATEKQETRLYRIIDSYVNGIAQKDFIPSPGLGCMGCQYFNECRNWGGCK